MYKLRIFSQPAGSHDLTLFLQFHYLYTPLLPILPLWDSNHYAMPIMLQNLVNFFLWYCSVCRVSFCSIMGLTSPQYPLHLGLWGLFLLYFFILKDILGCKDSLLLLLSESLEGTLSYCACTNYIACETFTLQLILNC